MCRGFVVVPAGHLPSGGTAQRVAAAAKNRVPGGKLGVGELFGNDANGLLPRTLRLL